MKRFVLAAVVAVLLVPAVPVSAMLIDIDNGADVAGTEEDSVMEAFIYLPGEVVEASDSAIHVRSALDDGITIVNITSETFVVDAISGLNTSIAQRTGDVVAVYHSPIMTRSYPPITNAFAIVTSIPADFQAPRYTIVEQVQEEDGDIRIITDNGALIITLSADASVTQEVITSRGAQFTKGDIAEGDRMLLYYVAVLMSHPAQATARKAVRLEHGGLIEAANAQPAPPYQNNNGQEQAEYQNNAQQSPNGFSLSISRSYEQDGATWVPLREVAEALGMEVEWNPQERSVGVSYEGTNATVRIGYDGELRGDTTYVSLAFFRDVLEITSHRLADVIVFYR